MNGRTLVCDANRLNEISHRWLPTEVLDQTLLIMN